MSYTKIPVTRKHLEELKELLKFFEEEVTEKTPANKIKDEVNKIAPTIAADFQFLPGGAENGPEKHKPIDPELIGGTDVTDQFNDKGGKIFKTDTERSMDMTKLNLRQLQQLAREGRLWIIFPENGKSPSFYAKAKDLATTNLVKVVDDKNGKRAFPWSENTQQPLMGAEFVKIFHHKQGHGFGLPEGVSVDAEGNIVGLTDKSVFGGNEIWKGKFAREDFEVKILPM